MLIYSLLMLALLNCVFIYWLNKLRASKQSIICLLIVLNTSGIIIAINGLPQIYHFFSGALIGFLISFLEKEGVL